MRINRKVIESAAVGAFALVILATAKTAGTSAVPYTGETLTKEAELQVATKEKTVVDLVAAAEEPEEGAAGNALNAGIHPEALVAELTAQAKAREAEAAAEAAKAAKTAAEKADG